MSQFVKSVLNYYAAFTETRFSNRSTLNYKWLDDANLTLDVSFFTDLFHLWVEKLEDNDRTPVDIRANQFKREIPAARFRQKLDDLLRTSFNQEALQRFIAEERDGIDLNAPGKLGETFLEGTRTYNLALRKAIEQLIYALQKEEIAAIEQQFRATRLPAPTFNIPKFSQDIYDDLQHTSAECSDEEGYLHKVEAILAERDHSIVLYDLLILLKQFAVVETYGTSYLFFGSIQQDKGNGKGNPDYPLCFIEVNFDTSMADCIRLIVPRDLVMLNTPAINSFDFQNVLTIPRAASFSGSIAHLRQMDSFLTGEYNMPPQTITTNENCFIPPPKDGLPYLKYRFGLQVIKNEDKRILDYSELMTKIEKGEGSAIIDFVDGYLKGNVVNTYDQTNSQFRSEYPKNSAKTEEMDRSSIRVSDVEKDVTLFLSEDYEDEVGEDNLFALNYLKSIRGKFDRKQLKLFGELDPFIMKNQDRIRALYGYKSPYAVNTSIFKTPQNLSKVTATPEKLFVYGLIEHARYVQAWLKSRDMGFYSIDYEYFRKGKDRIRASFNPDFFIKMDLNKYIRILKGEGTDVQQLRALQDSGYDTIIRVVEIKSDDDDDEATPAKKRYADEHFAVLNEKLQNGSIPADFIRDNNFYERQLYTFDLLIPSQFNAWFKDLARGQDERYGKTPTRN